MIFTIAMWLHAILSAMVFYRPTPPPHEWIGELRLFPIIITVIIVDCLVWVAVQ